MQPEFFIKTGKMALSSRLRMLTAKIIDDAIQLYQLYGNDLQPKWLPVFYVYLPMIKNYY